MSNKITVDSASKIYDILEKDGGASPHSRNSFVYHMTEDTPTEWRFQGHFGFGGKYRPDTNKIDYYRENHTPELDLLEAAINSKLKSVFS